MTSPVLVAGAGPGGLVTAHALLRRGLPVVVLERFPEIRVAGAGLTLQINAMRMLAALGLADAVIAAGAPLDAASLETDRGRVIQATDLSPFAARFGVPGIGIHRARLADVLREALPQGLLRLGARVVDVRQDADGVTAVLDDGEEVHGRALVGADGLHSAVRTALFGPIAPRYAGYTAWRGLAPVDAPVRTTERWGAGRRFGFVPVAAGLTYWFATLDTPAGGVDGPDPKAELKAIFADFAAPVAALLDATPDGAILRSDIADLPTLPRWTEGRITLLGDAAHATTPNLGQGACQAIEDAVVLGALLAATPDDPAAAFVAYEAARRPRALRIVRESDRFGRVAQWRSPLARALRDRALGLLPARLLERQLLDLYGVPIPP